MTTAVTVWEDIARGRRRPPTGGSAAAVPSARAHHRSVRESAAKGQVPRPAPAQQSVRPTGRSPCRACGAEVPGAMPRRVVSTGPCVTGTALAAYVRRLRQGHRKQSRNPSPGRNARPGCSRGAEAQASPGARDFPDEPSEKFGVDSAHAPLPSQIVRVRIISIGRPPPSRIRCSTPVRRGESTLPPGPPFPSIDAS